ncbi:hypothetical protein BGW80DRAFT_548827 [Lactifluus volemus]|nr:hypothetical protein BGW80DRAFT_548827 [Lactifluus volemus]
MHMPPGFGSTRRLLRTFFPLSSACPARTCPPACHSSMKSGARPTMPSSASGPANPRSTSGTCACSKVSAHPSHSFASCMPDDCQGIHSHT